MVLNLTQSGMNIGLSTNQATVYSSGGFPLAAGPFGVVYQGSAKQNKLPNVKDLSGSNNYFSTQPAIIASGTGYTYQNPSSFLSPFVMFPSWTANYAATGNYAGNQVTQLQYLTSSNASNAGAVVVNSTISGGYPSTDGLKGTVTTAHVQTMQGSSTTTITLTLPDGMFGSNDVFSVNINSLGGTVTTPPINVNWGAAMWDVLGKIIDILCDISSVREKDPVGIAAMIYGMSDSINAAGTALVDNAAPNTFYGATYNGINVSATANIQNPPGVFMGAPSLVLKEGDVQGLLYQVQAQGSGIDNASSILPLSQQNRLLITTWRPVVPNTGMGGNQLSSSDLLIVAVLNNAVSAANATQQYINNSAQVQSTAGRKIYQPTPEDAKDSMKILEILTVISKKNPKDAQFIIDSFGVHGKYEKIRHDPVALKNLHIELKNILSKHKNELPAITPYLQKLEQQG